MQKATNVNAASFARLISGLRILEYYYIPIINSVKNIPL